MFANPEMGMLPKLGIVAGGGTLPARLARACQHAGREVFIVALRGHADPDVIGDLPHAWVRLGAAGKAIDLLRQHDVAEIVLAGDVRRPSLSELKPDLRAARFAAKGFLTRGDDGLLGAVVKALEDEEGFRVLGVQDVLGGLLAGEEDLGRLSPTERDLADIARGVAVLDRLADADVGQAIGVQDGVVLGIEALEGTDALIARCGALRRDGRGPVLVKLPKRGQERRVDLPTIGPKTIEGALEAGFAGIAVAAGETLLVEAETSIAKADAGGLFLHGLSLGTA